MARTYRNLWPEVVSWENLVTAYQRCRRRKRYKRDAAEFHFAWEANLLDLQRELVSGHYLPGPYRHHRIVDPKPRKISAAPFRDRVVHHAVVGVLEPIYERRFLFDSYACRRGKGTHRALVRAHAYLRRYEYFLKTDIVRFFPNVDHALLLDQIGRTIRDERLMDLIRTIIASGEGVLTEEATHDYFPGDDLFSVLRPAGLPIGNLTSQFFANVLLDPIDHFIKEELRVPGYVRYADDLVLFSDSKSDLWQYRDALAKRLGSIRLRLHRQKTHVAHRDSGLRFLGFVLTPATRRMQQRTLARFNRRMRRLRWLFAHGKINAAPVRQSLQAWKAHAMWANSKGIQRNLWRRLRLSRRRRPRDERPGLVEVALEYQPEPDSQKETQGQMGGEWQLNLSPNLSLNLPGNGPQEQIR